MSLSNWRKSGNWHLQSELRSSQVTDSHHFLQHKANRHTFHTDSYLTDMLPIQKHRKEQNRFVTVKQRRKALWMLQWVHFSSSILGCLFNSFMCPFGILFLCKLELLELIYEESHCISPSRPQDSDSKGARGRRHRLKQGTNKRYVVRNWNMVPTQVVQSSLLEMEGWRTWPKTQLDTALSSLLYRTYFKQGVRLHAFWMSLPTYTTWWVYDTYTCHS